MSEESKAQEKPEAKKSWVSGPLMEKLSLSVDPAKFFEWPDAMQPLEELQTESWQNLMSPALAALNEINQRASEAFGEMRRMMEQQVRALDQAANQFASALASIDLEAIGRDHAEGAKELAKRGWFITLDSPLYFHSRFLELIRASRWKECERELEEHYQELLPSIRDQLFERFPERKPILQEAFKFHEEGMFFGAISHFLAQSDGIGHSIFGALPLSRKNLRAIEKWLDARVEPKDWFDGYWRGICRELPITANTDDLGKYLDPLNRHAVLHGLDLTYGTKRNSLKAIAWIQYVASFAILDDEKRSRRAS